MTIAGHGVGEEWVAKKIIVIETVLQDGSKSCYGYFLERTHKSNNAPRDPERHPEHHFFSLWT